MNRRLGVNAEPNRSRARMQTIGFGSTLMYLGLSNTGFTALPLAVDRVLHSRLIEALQMESICFLIKGRRVANGNIACISSNSALSERQYLGGGFLAMEEGTSLKSSCNNEGRYRSPTNAERIALEMD